MMEKEEIKPELIVAPAPEPIAKHFGSLWGVDQVSIIIENVITWIAYRRGAKQCLRLTEDEIQGALEDMKRAEKDETGKWLFFPTLTECDIVLHFANDKILIIKQGEDMGFCVAKSLQEAYPGYTIVEMKG